MDGWQLGLLAAAAYLAVVSLVRLMRKRRDVLEADMRQQSETEKQRQKRERSKASHKQGQASKAG